jgi:hypothetical protein
MLTTNQLINYYNEILNIKDDKTLFFQIVLSFILLILIYYTIFPRYIKLQPSKNIILITGCDTGFGNLLAKKCNLHGYQVVAACLTDDGIYLTIYLTIYICINLIIIYLFIYFI